MPLEFVRDVEGGDPPIARMIRGGRGGEVRLKLYLTLALIATKPPHAMLDDTPAQRWAEMFDLPAHVTLGARRVSDALRWLDANDFIDLTSKQGTAPKVALLHASGDGGPFRRGRGQYLRVPLELWSNGWILALSGTGLALLLVLLDLQGGIKVAAQAPTLVGGKKDRYGLSDDTWTRGRHELEGLGLLTVTRTPQGSDFTMTRMRNRYWINKAALESSKPIVTRQRS